MDGRINRSKVTRDGNDSPQLRLEKEEVEITNEARPRFRDGITQDRVDEAPLHQRYQQLENKLAETEREYSKLINAYAELEGQKRKTDGINESIATALETQKRDAEREKQNHDDFIRQYDSQNTTQEEEIVKLKSIAVTVDESKRTLLRQLQYAEKAEKDANIRAKTIGEKHTKCLMEIEVLKQELQKSHQEVKRIKTERNQYQTAADTEKKEKEESKAKCDALQQEFEDSKRELGRKVPDDGQSRHRSMLPFASNTRSLSSRAHSNTSTPSDEGPNPKPGDVFKSRTQRPDLTSGEQTTIKDVKIGQVEKDLREAKDKIAKLEASLTAKDNAYQQEKASASKTRTKIQELESEISRREKSEAVKASLKPEEERVVMKDVEKGTFDFVKHNPLLMTLLLVISFALGFAAHRIMDPWIPANANSNAYRYLIKYRSLEQSPIWLSTVFSEPQLDAAAKFLGLPDKVVYG